MNQGSAGAWDNEGSEKKMLLSSSYAAWGYSVYRTIKGPKKKYLKKETPFKRKQTTTINKLFKKIKQTKNRCKGQRRIQKFTKTLRTLLSVIGLHSTLVHWTLATQTNVACSVDPSVPTVQVLPPAR